MRDLSGRAILPDFPLDEDTFDNGNNLKVSVFLMFTISNGSRFQIGMVRRMKLFLLWITFGKHCYVTFFMVAFAISFIQGLCMVAGNCNVVIYSSVE